MAGSFDVVVVGSCMRDLTSYVERLPRPGETILGRNFVAGFGGKGANQCLAAARLGGTTAMVANLGNDSYGAEYINTFQAQGVNTKFVTKTDESHTGIASIFVTDNGENCIVIVSGANLFLSPDHVKKAESLIKSSKVLICQLESNFDGTMQALSIAKQNGVKTVFNAAPAQKNLPSELFPLCDIFCVNETEAEFVSGLAVKDVKDAVAAAEKIIAKGCKTVIITLGEKGAVYLCDDKTVGYVPAKSVKAVDTTGAGDAFVGSLSFYLANYSSLPLPTVIQRACDIASISVQSPGTHVSFPWKKDLPSTMF